MTMNAVSSLEQSTVAVVIATNKRDDSLDRCLRSFLSILEDPEDLIFVDNGSDEHLSVSVSKKFRGLTTVRLEANRLFCGGYNAGIKRAVERGYGFVLISNADSEVVNPGFIVQLLEVAERWPRAAFIGPLVYFRDRDVVQKTCLKFPDVVRGAAIWLPWRLARGYIDRQATKERGVEFLNGVCVLCRIEALKEIGLMDENMGGYVEDADWAWRAREKGWLSVFTPVPSVIHHENPNGYEPYSLKTFLLKRNTVLWFLKTGQRTSAFTYAGLSIGLGRVRMMVEQSTLERKKHQYFLERLGRAYQGLLRGEEFGEWFGPPLGPWDDMCES
jgi:N-acetylglucosaminyl-diphospho-decaprenol L-rhamnosyltransferase